MKKMLLRGLALVATAGAMFAQNLTGTWQGTLAPPQAAKPLRLVVKITRADDEKLKGQLFSIDQGGQALNTTTMTLQGSTLKMTIAGIGMNFEGKVNAEADTITGAWAQGPPGAPTLPLVLNKATAGNEWVIPEPVAPPKPMAPDAKPTFDVATIKPSNPATPGQSILVGRGGQNLFTTTNTTLADLIIFAYGLHPRQVTGGPAWMESERFDITAKPDQPGIPSVTQLKDMVQNLLKERFELAFHKDKKELSAYAMTVAKSGVKITKSESTGNLPGFGGRGPGSVGIRNSTMEEFAGFLQSRIVERPVVDQTGLQGRYDFTLTWTPDAAMNPNAPPPPAPAAGVEPPPDLFAAFQQQLGLKLDSAKLPVEVLVIDKVTKPSAN